MHYQFKVVLCKSLLYEKNVCCFNSDIEATTSTDQISKPVIDNKPITHRKQTRSSAIAEGPRDASCQLKTCQLPRNSAETTYTTSPDQIDGMKLEV